MVGKMDMPRKSAHILVVDSSKGMYAFAEIDPEHHDFAPGNTLVDPLSAPTFGFSFDIYKTSPRYSDGKGLLYFPTGPEIEQIATETITGLKADLEQRIRSSHADAALVEITGSRDGDKLDRGNFWIIVGRAILIKYIPLGPYLSKRD
jgi:hypothetical protein